MHNRSAIAKTSRGFFPKFAAGEHVSRRLAFADQLLVAEFEKSLPFRVLVKIFESYGHTVLLRGGIDIV